MMILLWSLLIKNNFVYLMKRCNKRVKKNVLLCLSACFVCLCVIDTNRNLTSGFWKDRKTKRRSVSVTEWGIVETDKWVKVEASRTCSGSPELCRVTQRPTQMSDIWSEERKGVREKDRPKRRREIQSSRV